MHQSGSSNNEAAQCTTVSICHENHEMPYCPKFCQLITRKIIRIVATRCQIFGDKNVQNSISAGAPLQTKVGGAYIAPPLPWLHLRGILLRGGERGECKRRRKGGTEIGVWAPQSSPQIDASDRPKHIIIRFMQIMIIIVSVFSKLETFAKIFEAVSTVCKCSLGLMLCRTCVNGREPSIPTSAR